MTSSSSFAERAFLGFTTRSLLICVVFGAATGALLYLGRFVGVLLRGVAPWLGSPSALIPWFVFVLAAALLVPRAGSALIAGVVGTIVGVGTMSFMAGVMIEIAFVIARAAQRRRGGLAPIGDRRWLRWSILGGWLTGLMTFAILFTVQEFLALPMGLMALGLLVRIVAGVAYGWLAWVLVRAVLRAGFVPERPQGRSGS